MTLEITELIFNWINLRLISSKKVLATQGENAGITEKTTIFVSYIYVCIQYFVYILLDFNCVIIYIIF